MRARPVTETDERPVGSECRRRARRPRLRVDPSTRRRAAQSNAAARRARAPCRAARARVEDAARALERTPSGDCSPNATAAFSGMAAAHCRPPPGPAANVSRTDPATQFELCQRVQDCEPLELGIAQPASGMADRLQVRLLGGPPIELQDPPPLTARDDGGERLSSQPCPIPIATGAGVTSAMATTLSRHTLPNANCAGSIREVAPTGALAPPPASGTRGPTTSYAPATSSAWRPAFAS